MAERHGGLVVDLARVQELLQVRPLEEGHRQERRRRRAYLVDQDRVGMAQPRLQARRLDEAPQERGVLPGGEHLQRNRPRREVDQPLGLQVGRHVDRALALLSVEQLVDAIAAERAPDLERWGAAPLGGHTHPESSKF
jgi:hypothetical protein